MCRRHHSDRIWWCHGSTDGIMSRAKWGKQQGEGEVEDLFMVDIYQAAGKWGAYEVFAFKLLDPPHERPR